MVRKIKKYWVIKSTFYIKSPLDFGYKEEKIKHFSNLTDACWWAENNISKYIMKKDKNTYLQVVADFGDNKNYVLSSYTL